MASYKIWVHNGNTLKIAEGMRSLFVDGAMIVSIPDSDLNIIQVTTEVVPDDLMQDALRKVNRTEGVAIGWK